jgi:hypothetical protein
VLTALMVAGRVGSGIAAELGIDGGDRPDQRAAGARHRSHPQAGVPRMLAGLIMVPS